MSVVIIGLSFTCSELLCTASRHVSAAVNSSTEFTCSPECTSTITWNYTSPQSNSRSLLTPRCLIEGRCQVQTNAARQQNLLSIDQVQFKDAGTYICSSGTENQPDYCELSFNFTGNFLCIRYIMYRWAESRLKVSTRNFLFLVIIHDSALSYSFDRQETARVE